MVKEIVIDFETMDYGLREDLGPGWPWGGVTVLGMAWMPLDGTSESRYETNLSKIVSILHRAEVVVAHNAQYEAGIMHMLGIDVTQKTIYCTKLASLFVKSNRFDSSLGTLAEQELGEKKTRNTLVDSAIELGLITPQKSYFSENTDSVAYKNAHKRAENSVWEVLDRLQFLDATVEMYANKDAALTQKLFSNFIAQMGAPLTKVYKRFCKLIQVTTLMRAKGIRVDLKRAYEVKGLLKDKLIPIESALWEREGVFNYSSDKQVKKWAEDLGLSPEPDIHGKLGYGKAWVDTHQSLNKSVHLFGECKRYMKAIEFCDSVVKFEKNGRVHPELTILGARTGRFTSRNPNIQQIPGRDKEIGPLIRSIYLPEKGENWYSLDYSGQEDRLRVHFAAKMGNKKGLELVQQFICNPTFDTHEDTKNQMNTQLGKEVLTRSMAKIQNHGISYGMGVGKQARALGVTEREAKSLKSLFFKINPHVKDLFDKTKAVAEARGFLKTVGGRHVHTDQGFEYKALSALIQGSALDQTAEAMIQCYERGIIPLAVIHDEIAISGDEIKARVVKSIMENAVKLEIPTVTDIGSGNNWAEAK